MEGEFVREYDKCFKDLLSQIAYTRDEQLLVQWFITKLLQNIQAPLRMHMIENYDEALKKSQQFEFDEDSYMTEAK